MAELAEPQEWTNSSQVEGKRALRSCIIHAEVGAVQHISPGKHLALSITYWLKLKPLRLNAMVLMPMEVNQMPTRARQPGRSEGCGCC